MFTICKQIQRCTNQKFPYNVVSKLLINAKLKCESDNTRIRVTYFNAYEMSKEKN